VTSRKFVPIARKQLMYRNFLCIECYVILEKSNVKCAVKISFIRSIKNIKNSAKKDIGTS
jgi:hypothetical protein